MSLNNEEVKKIAWLARIDIRDEDLPGYAQDLSGILDLVEQLSAVDTDQIIPLAHPLNQVQRLRADEVTEADHRDLFQSQAPQTEAGLYLVPKVIE